MVLIRVIAAVGTIAFVMLLVLAAFGKSWVETGRPKVFTKFYHDILHWHRPTPEIAYQGYMMAYSTCACCGKTICSFKDELDKPWWSIEEVKTL